MEVAKKVRIIIATYKNVPKTSFKFSCHFQLWCMVKNCLKNENHSACSQSPKTVFEPISKQKGDVYCVWVKRVGSLWRYRAVARSENPGGHIVLGGDNVPPGWNRVNWSAKNGGGALCVEMGFTWTFHRNQDATVKLKTEPISIKF